MEQWIGSVHSKMASKFGVYRILEKSSSNIKVRLQNNTIIISKSSIFWEDVHMATTEVTSCHKQHANEASSV